MKRVVVTGLGVVSPIGCGVEDAWANALRGVSGIGVCSTLDLSQEPVRICGEIKDFDPTKWMNEKEARRTQRFVQLAIAASKMAVEDAGLEVTDANRADIGISIGVGVGGMQLIEDQIGILHGKGSRWVSPFTIPGFIANMAAGGAAIHVGAQGPNLCSATACASGTHAIGDALMLIQTGRAKVMIAGGSESALSPIAFAGFARMGAITKGFNDNPTAASRPFDKGRSGFVMSEGASVLALEELEFAQARGANILCELVGFGLSGDAHHITLPPPEGAGAQIAMRQALRTAGVNPEDVDYINAHGTSTEANDVLETQAIKKVFGDHAYKLNVSSTKSMTGHLLGAAGGIEALFTVMALKTGWIPPTINLDEPDPECDLNYTANTAVQRDVRVAISNSFGFGGTNACLCFQKF